MDGKHDNLNNNKSLSANYEPWLKTEFEQNFKHLRDRDSKIIGITKFYVTAVLSIGSIAIALLGLKDLKCPYVLVGLLLLGACIVGEILLVWMTAFRRYFVRCARQLNAIRHLYSKNIPPQERNCIIQPLDSSIPRMLHRSSAHIAVLALMTFINAILAALGSFGLISRMIALTDAHRIVISVLSFILVFLLNDLYIKKRLGKEDKNDK